jgi:hypothetical protein
MSTSVWMVKSGTVARDSAIRRATTCWVRVSSSILTSPLAVPRSVTAGAAAGAGACAGSPAGSPSVAITAPTGRVSPSPATGRKTPAASAA